MRRGWPALAAVAVAAAAVPLALRWLVEDRLRSRVAPRLSAALGEDVRIAGAEVGLTGTFRLSGVRVGTTVAADSVEASVGLGSLLRGTFAADELRVERPRLAARLTPDGRIDLQDLMRRARDARRRAARGGGGGGRAGGDRVRRILVTGGELVVSVPGGELRAAGVELHPQDGGVRVVTGRTTATMTRGVWTAAATFERGGLDLDLPELHVRRAALDGGTLVAHGGDAPPLSLDGIIVTRGIDDGEASAHGGTAAPDGQLRVVATVAGGAQRLALAVRTGPLALSVEADDLPLAPFGPALPDWIDASSAHAAGRATFTRDGETLQASGELSVRDLVTAHPLLDDRPFPVTFAIAGDAAWDPAARHAQADLRMSSGVLAATTAIEAELAGGLSRLAVYLDAPPVPCGAALAAIPFELRRGVDGLDLGGTIGGRVDLAYDRAAPEATRLDLALAAACKVERDPAGADAAALRGRYTHTLPDGALRLMDGDDPDFVELDDLPSHVAGAFVAAEDARFYDHSGFDPEQLRRSLAWDLSAGHVARGGSTISQQLVKNLWLTRERTLARKLVEAVLTWRVEQRVPKRRILEVYLNLIELGDGVYGLRPAARHWFGKEPKDLTVAEAAFLAALTPAPVTMDRRIRAAGALDPATLYRVEVTLRAMKRAHVITPSKHADAAADARHLSLNLSGS